MQREEIVAWVKAALAHAGMGQAELGRQMAARGHATFDRSTVNKIIQNKRAVSAEEMIAFAEITGFGRPHLGRTSGAPSDLSSEDVAAELQSPPPRRLGRKLMMPKSERKPSPLLSVPIVRQVPVIDWVTAGKLSAPASQIPVHDVPLLAFADLGSGDFFALKVSGDSMDRVSPEGSTIVVNRDDRTLVSGRCYVFSVRGETTYKRWQSGEPAYLDPYSTNPAHKPYFPKKKGEVEVVGRVRRTLLDL